MWARLSTAALGAWLMAAPGVLSYAGAVAASHRIVGPIVSGNAFIAAWPLMRPLRWIGLVAGVLLVALAGRRGGAGLRRRMVIAPHKQRWRPAMSANRRRGKAPVSLQIRAQGGYE